MQSRNVEALKNIGSKLAGRLNAVGIFSEDDLRQAGPVQTHRMIAELFPTERLPLCYYLYSFEGALRDMHWNAIGEERKQELRAAIAR